MQVSPDENPVLDRHPQYMNIVIGAGFSGNAFILVLQQHVVTEE